MIDLRRLEALISIIYFTLWKYFLSVVGLMIFCASCRSTGIATVNLFYQFHSMEVFLFCYSFDNFLRLA